jgi:hypothetical protein
LHALSLQPHALRNVRAEDLAPADFTARIDDAMPGHVGAVGQIVQCVADLASPAA